MNNDPTAIERAFQLAKSGDCLSIAEIRTKLKKEGFTLEQITGGALTKQLTKLIRATMKNLPNAKSAGTAPN